MKQDFQGGEDHPASPETAAGISRRMAGGSFAAIGAWLAGAGMGRAATGRDARKNYMPELGTDYATTDPPFYDPEFPPIHFPHVFMSKGTAVQSFMWLADNNDAKGCVIISPQVSGGDCLDSVIPALLSAGINVMRFNPRGMWDNDQEYSYIGHLDDLHAAVAFLRQNGGKHITSVGQDRPRPYQIDVDRIAIMGQSGGGALNGWVAAAEDPSLNTVIAIEPTVLRPLPPEYVPYLQATKKGTAGRIDNSKWLAELTPADRDRMDMIKAAPRLIDKNILLIGYLSQHYLEYDHRPLVQAMTEAGAKHFAEVIMETDNFHLLTKRIALARLVISWLKTECGF